MVTVGVTATCVWTLVEIQVGIIAACAPTIRPAVRMLIQRGFFDNHLRSGSSAAIKRSSQSNVHISTNHALPSFKSHNKRGVEDEDAIHLHTLTNLNTANVENSNDSEVPKHGATLA